MTAEISSSKRCHVHAEQQLDNSGVGETDGRISSDFCIGGAAADRLDLPALMPMLRNTGLRASSVIAAMMTRNPSLDMLP
jgi:hypothetical protein